VPEIASFPVADDRRVWVNAELILMTWESVHILEDDLEFVRRLEMCLRRGNPASEAVHDLYRVLQSRRRVPDGAVVIASNYYRWTEAVN
jgi:hypothetical protein